eukprot:TRINITY_DN6530_c0_g1_i2.p1 TRINITY_DN6530_c0_g1~~TRINITY_DN6530_c0_g1_i2.p1  ORF type:complete len:108 (+),score=23.00 TRINITY_DN6530_c0_g1_i2:45-368(+)
MDPDTPRQTRRSLRNSTETPSANDADLGAKGSDPSSQDYGDAAGHKTSSGGPQIRIKIKGNHLQSQRDGESSKVEGNTFFWSSWKLVAVQINHESFWAPPELMCSLQ